VRPRDVRIAASILIPVTVMGLYAAEPGPLMCHVPGAI
jgi:hypothetical protein